MKILIIGGTGMLGHKLVQVLQKKHHVGATVRGTFSEFEAYGFLQKENTFENVDAEVFSTVERVVDEFEPEVLINAVGVIKQLPSAKNAVKTIYLNSLFPHLLAELTQKAGIRLITIGTDCVFDGKKGNYTEDDIPDAQDLYGKSKSLGEVVGENCLTLRTSIIGRELKSAHSLIDWFLSNQGKSVKGFTNAIFSGFPTIILAEIIQTVIENFPQLNGLYHVASDPINKYELLKLTREAFGVDVEIEAFNDFRIDRSLDASKFKSATAMNFPDWKTMIEIMAKDKAIYRA